MFSKLALNLPSYNFILLLYGSMKYDTNVRKSINILSSMLPWVSHVLLRFTPIAQITIAN